MRDTWRYLLPVLVVGIAIRLAFASGFVDFDDHHYIERAYELSAGIPSAEVAQQGARTGLVAPTAALFACCGVSVATAVALPFACSVLGLVCVFLLGRMLFDARTACLAAALLAVFPLDVIFAARLSPTAPIGLFGGAAILLFLLGERDTRWPLLLAAGVSLGLACSFGETPLLALLAYAAYVATLGRPARRHGAALLGLAGVFAVELAVTGWLTGNPLLRLQVLTAADTVRGRAADVAHASWTAGWLLNPLIRLATEQELGLFFLLGLPVAALRLFRSDSKPERGMALSVLVLFAWISYGTVSPFTYAPLARLPRYLSLIQLPLVLLLALWLRRLRPRNSLLVTLAIVASSIVCVVVDGSRTRSAPYEQVRDLVARDRPARVVVDERLLMPFLLFEGYQPGMPVAVLREVEGAPRVVERVADRPGERVAELATPGTYVIAREPSLLRWLGGRDDLERIQRFPPPDTPYRRLLRNDRFRALLALGRSEFRMRSLREKTGDADTIEVYAVVARPR